MTVVIVVERESQIGRHLRWALRVAATRGGETVVVVPREGHDSGPMNVDLAADEHPAAVRPLAVKLIATLGKWLDDGAWHAAGSGPAAERNGGSGSPEPPPLAVRLRAVSPSQVVEETVRLLPDARSDLLILVAADAKSGSAEWDARRRTLLTRCGCEGVHVRPGQRTDDGEILVAVTHGPDSRAAMRLARALAGREARQVTALHVEPDIGPDAASVGQRILDRLLADLVDEEGPDVRQRVAIDDRADKGILRVCQEDRFEVVMMGAPQLAGFGQHPSGVTTRVVRGTDEPTLIFKRATVRLRNRLRRWAGHQVQRFVPQLERHHRTDLVERIQSNAQWDFDFVVLMGLSTLIAAMGLVDDSAAVIIGAMLVAPLMTPLMGLGLALTQGNPRLARMTVKAVGYGFLTAFGLSLLVGLLSGGFEEATGQMRARDWPQMLDLSVAFVAGLAAAYASSRPGLLAALPGVAIAAALVPPIATAGLAVSVGDLDLAAGAVLLFAVNMVAIILASAMSLWAVGFRYLRQPTMTTRVLGRGLIVAASIMALGFAIIPPQSSAPAELVTEVEQRLPDSHRLRDIRLHNESVGVVLQIDLGGSSHPDPELATALHALARQHLGPAASVRITFRYEVLLR